jgi:hypothetical protein
MVNPREPLFIRFLLRKAAQHSFALQDGSKTVCFLMEDEAEPSRIAREQAIR